MRAAVLLFFLPVACGGPELEEEVESAAVGYEDREAACSDGRDNDGDGWIDCSDFGCKRHAFCRPSTLRVATFNVQSLSAVGSSEFAAAREIVARVDADVICLQEVEDFEGTRLERLAADAGYPHLFMGEARTWMAGGLTNACLSRHPIVEAHSLASSMISSDARADEIARDLVEVRVELIPGHRYATLIAAHLKSGFHDSDRFRRQIEAMRVRDRVLALRSSRPRDAFVVMGDFNEEVDGSSLGRRFSSLPTGMPSSFRLGSDVAFPIDYQPFEAFAAAGLTLTDPTHEDTLDQYGTRIPSGRRIDFLLISGARVAGDEVYEACQDDGADAPPVGQFLRKAGAPLPCGTSLGASDHRPVLADLTLHPR